MKIRTLYLPAAIKQTDNALCQFVRSIVSDYTQESKGVSLSLTVANRSRVLAGFVCRLYLQILEQLHNGHDGVNSIIC